MSNRVDVPAPKPEFQIVITKFTNNQVNIAVPDDLEVALDLAIFGMKMIQDMKRQKPKSMIEVPNLKNAAADYMKASRF